MSYTVTIEPGGTRFRAREDETLLQAARREGLCLPHECGWGSCGTCKVTLDAGETEHLFAAAPAIKARDARRRRILGCQAMARSDLTIRLSPGTPPQPPLPSREQRAELIAVEDLAPEVRRFTFAPEDGAEFLPGQYAIFHLGPDLRRAYSMSNLPDGRTLQIISKRYEGGAGSTALAAMQPGDALVLESPFGTCVLKNRPGRAIFVAGGTGISPILSLVAQAGRDAVQFAAPVDVIYSARSPADLAAGDELAQAAARIPDAHYRPYVETGAVNGLGAGRATDAISAATFDADSTEFYVAGPPAMVAAVRAQLQEAGVPITRIRFDSFG